MNQQHNPQMQIWKYDLWPTVGSKQVKVMDRHLDVTFRFMPQSQEEQFVRDFPFRSDGLYRSEPGDYVVPATFVDHADRVYNFQPRVDDVWIVTFPKSGTTWTQEMAWLIINDCNFEGAKRTLDQRSPFLEFPYLARGFNEQDETIFGHGGLDQIRQMKSPRLIKTHLPFFFLHPELLNVAKVIYVARNPKDVIVSFFFHHKLLKKTYFTGDLDAFADYFMKDEMVYLPYFQHVLDAWNRRHHPNLLFIFYEELIKDLRGGIDKVADFLDKSFDQKQLDQLTQHLLFDNFVTNEAVNFEFARNKGLMNLEGRFIRKGRIGDWKNHFSPELNQRIDQWIESNSAGTDLKFVYEFE